MKQKQFESQHEALWAEIEAILDDRSSRREALPELYRRLCQSLALANQRGYSPLLTDYLQKRVTDCHKLLYGTAVERPFTLHRWMMHEFPRRVRAEWRLLLAAMVAFWGVALLIWLLVWFKPYWAYSFVSPEQLYSYRKMYDPANVHIGRDGGSDIMMFGFYIWNNVSICFRTFAGGIMGGIPALISLVFNGMHLGVIGSSLCQEADTRRTFTSFVITHSSFEITGLMLSGVAGMRLGLSLIRPGRLSRRHSLSAASQAMFPVIVGAALMTVLAAFFEAFWSASTAIPVPVKYGVGAGCWLLVIAFFAFSGRTRRAWN